MSFLIVITLIVRAMIDICFKACVTFSKQNSMLKKLSYSPFAWMAYVLIIINFVSWTYLLSFYPLSFIFPLFSFSFVLIFFSGKLFFNESFDRYKYLGLLSLLLSAFILILM